MRIKTTKKEMKRAYKNIITIGYCEMTELLCYEEPITYCVGTYGWTCDNYLIDRHTLISTGYAPINGIRVDYKKVHKYSELGREIRYNKELTEEQKRNKIKKLLDKFVKEVLKENEANENEK